MNAELDHLLAEAHKDPGAKEFAGEIADILTAYRNEEITREEAQYLLNEMKDVRAAESLAGQEVALRYIVQACEMAGKII